MTTFGDIRRRALYGCILRAKFFAEEVTLLLPGGGSVMALALIGKANSGWRDNSDESRSVEEIQVRLGRDQEATYGGEAIGGLLRPMAGLGLIRANDPDRRPYSFDSIVSSDADSWLLAFSRQRTERLGMKQTQQQ